MDEATEIGNSSPKQAKFTCLCCRIRFDSPNLQRQHFKTEWHLYNLKRRVSKLDPVDLSTFEMNDDNAWETDEDEEFSDYEYDAGDDETEQDELELLKNVIKTDKCLFCGKKSSNMEENVKHMYSHGFYIPEDQYLSDLKGLLTYLGFKVGAGATCLWCNKEFRSLHGARLHMLYKNHCKIYFDQDTAVKEFADFYDYSNQERIQMKPLSLLAIPKKRSERYIAAKQSRAVALIEKKQRNSNSKQLVVKNHSGLANYYHPTYVKKFNEHRTKILLKTGMANNETMRSRLRKQNPT